MPKFIKLYYADLPNMGDILNVLIMERYYNLKIKRATPLTCDMSAIGSGLGNFMFSNKLHIKAAQMASGIFCGEVNVWGTGFIENNREDTKFFRKKMNFHAVRGELSKKRVENILGHSISVVTGDAGLLADTIVKNPEEKKYEVGIIPHFREQGEPIFTQMREKYRNSIIIDLMKDPISVIKQIAKCEAVISSSLHGLIVADCYGIPNRWIVVSNKPKGDGFKFKDYYSAYGLDINPLDLKKQKIPQINQIIDEYKVDQEYVKLKKEQLLKCFPYKI